MEIVFKNCKTKKEIINVGGEKSGKTFKIKRPNSYNDRMKLSKLIFKNLNLNN